MKKNNNNKKLTVKNLTNKKKSKPQKQLKHKTQIKKVYVKSTQHKNVNHKKNKKQTHLKKQKKILRNKYVGGAYIQEIKDEYVCEETNTDDQGNCKCNNNEDEVYIIHNGQEVVVDCEPIFDNETIPGGMTQQRGRIFREKKTVNPGSHYDLAQQGHPPGDPNYTLAAATSGPNYALAAANGGPNYALAPSGIQGPQGTSPGVANYNLARRSSTSSIPQYALAGAHSDETNTECPNGQNGCEPIYMKINSSNNSLEKYLLEIKQKYNKIIFKYPPEYINQIKKFIIEHDYIDSYQTVKIYDKTYSYENYLNLDTPFDYLINFVNKLNGAYFVIETNNQKQNELNNLKFNNNIILDLISYQPDITKVYDDTKYDFYRDKKNDLKNFFKERINAYKKQSKYEILDNQMIVDIKKKIIFSSIFYALYNTKKYIYRKMKNLILTDENNNWLTDLSMDTGLNNNKDFKKLKSNNIFDTLSLDENMIQHLASLKNTYSNAMNDFFGIVDYNPNNIKLLMDQLDYTGIHYYLVQSRHPSSIGRVFQYGMHKLRRKQNYSKYGNNNLNRLLKFNNNN